MPIAQTDGFFSFLVQWMQFFRHQSAFHLICSATVLFLLFVVLAPIAKRFENEMGSTTIIVHIKRMCAWLMLFQGVACFLLIGERLARQNESFLLEEFLGYWGTSMVLFGTMTFAWIVCPAFVLFESHWKERREKGAGVALLRQLEGGQPPVDRVQELLQQFVKRYRRIIYPLVSPHFRLEGVVVVMLISLTMVFGAMWMKSVWVTQHATVATAYMAGGWAAESDLEKGEAPQDMVLRRRPISDEDLVPEDVRVEYWESELGYMHYIMQKGFVEGYNMYIKHARQKALSAAPE